jgi:hypothetical protein
LNYNWIDNFYLGINDRFARIIYVESPPVVNGGVWASKYQINIKFTFKLLQPSIYLLSIYLSISPNDVADRHKYWFGNVKCHSKMSIIVGTDNAAAFDIKQTSSTSGVWWLNIWVYTSTYCDSIMIIMRQV